MNSFNSLIQRIHRIFSISNLSSQQRNELVRNSQYCESSPRRRMTHTIEKISPLAQQYNGLSNNAQDDERIPFYMFRFEDDVDKSKYEELKRCIDAFEGNLKWILYYEPNQPPKRLYVIIPQKYAANCAIGRRRDAIGRWAERPVFQDEIYGEEVFIQDRDLAVIDTPKLIDWIAEWFNITESNNQY